MNKIKAHRARLGFTQIELAKRAGISPVTLHRAEQGHEPQAKTLHAIAGALGVTVEDLVGGGGSPKSIEAPERAQGGVQQAGERYAHYREYISAFDIDALNREGELYREGYKAAVETGDKDRAEDLYARLRIIEERLEELDPPFARIKVSMGDRGKRVEVTFLREATEEELARLEAEYPEYVVTTESASVA